LFLPTGKSLFQEADKDKSLKNVGKKTIADAKMFRNKSYLKLF
jgi:hypothetical protein